MLYFVNRTAQK